MPPPYAPTGSVTCPVRMVSELRKSEDMDGCGLENGGMNGNCSGSGIDTDLLIFGVGICGYAGRNPFVAINIAGAASLGRSLRIPTP